MSIVRSASVPLDLGGVLPKGSRLDWQEEGEEAEGAGWGGEDRVDSEDAECGAAGKDSEVDFGEDVTREICKDIHKNLRDGGLEGQRRG
ncbi:hypothetical protein C1H76_7543 [Elsinoe australis]|uniref:Uncharacterized protein n=1 Tax=Elsinoe australis TaxID=40998 RepID=A0A4U7AUE0_9PEZI|nr:hypothetical protein C1H76_7543 [Elsinoe australis]